MRKTLYILRHAKAEAGSVTRDDHQRTLTDRGLAAAETMGKYMMRHGIQPDKILCSTAERAMTTWERVQEAYKKPPPVEYSEKLYLASANEILRIVAETPEATTQVLLVGHNPGLHQLCLKLAKEGEEELLNTLTLKFPTCALAAIAFDGHWKEIAKARGLLTRFITPKVIEG